MTGLAVDLLADDVGVPGMPGGFLDDASITHRRLRVFPLRVTGASAPPTAAVVSLLASQAARYSARSQSAENAPTARKVYAALPK